MTFASPILRDESGAATRPEDMDIVLERERPRPQRQPGSHRAQGHAPQGGRGNHLSRGAFPGSNPAERLKAADAYIIKMLGEEALLDDKYKKGAAAPAGDTTSSVPGEDFSSMTDDQLREELNK